MSSIHFDASFVVFGNFNNASYPEKPRRFRHFNFYRPGLSRILLKLLRSLVGCLPHF